MTKDGLEGDAHRFKYHGGPERAVCLYPLESIERLRAEGHMIAPGILGENVTMEGLDWSTVVPGLHLLLGEQVLLQVTRYTNPCQTIKGAFKDGEFRRVSQKTHPGWSRVYARVLVEGVIRGGDLVCVLDEAQATALAAAST